MNPWHSSSSLPGSHPRFYSPPCQLAAADRGSSLRRALWCLVLAAWALGAVPAAIAALPAPLAQWNFEGDARDSVGSLEGELVGDASIVQGRLILNGAGYVRTSPLVADLAAKTLVARVKVDPLTQGGGGVITVQATNGLVFDSIVYGERVPGQWLAGSDWFRRTEDLVRAFPEEASAGWVQMAITYAADGTISVYRNGILYGTPYRPVMGLQLFGANTNEVVFGLRHTGGWNPYLKGEIDDAALYGRALTAEEVAELAGISLPSRPNLLTNGSFETGSLQPWQVVGQPDFGTNPPVGIIVTNSVNQDFRAQGTYSFLPHRSPTGVRLSQTVTTEHGREYVLTFAHALTDGTTGSFSVQINGVEQPAVVVDSSLPLMHRTLERKTWAYARRTFTATGPSTEVAFQFPRDLGEYILLDDVTVVPVESSDAAITLELATTEVTVLEGSSATLVVRRTGRLDQRAFATVELRSGLATVNGNAADADVKLQFGTAHSRQGLMFEPGQSEVEVTVLGQTDTLAEPPETATLHLLATGNATISGGPATVTVITPPTRIALWGTASEIQQAGEIALQVEQGPGGRVRVQTTDTGTAKPGEDFEPVDQEVVVSSFTLIRIVVAQDGQIEGHETIGIRVTPLSDNVEITHPELLIPLADEPMQVVVEVPQEGLTEGSGTIRATLKRTGALESPQKFQVRYRLEGWEGDLGDGRIASAGRPGVDFEPAEGLVEFGPGVTEQTVEIQLLNDGDVDGLRGLALRLLGSPEFPTFTDLANYWAIMVVADDERTALKQETAIAPFLPELIQPPRAFPRPNGSLLLLADHRLLQMLPSGTPDPFFGLGTGRSHLPHWPEWEAYPTPQSLPDGRMVFVEGTRIVRLTAQGGLDPSFGGDSGTMVLPEYILKFHADDDGRLTLLTVNNQRTYLRRLQPSGETDPTFSASDYPNGSGPTDLVVLPQGQLWLSFSSWQRFLADGRPDPNFTPRPGLMTCFGVDAAGRTYFQLSPGFAEEFGDATQGGLVRFLADGRYDEQYRPVLPKNGVVASTLIDSCEVSPDGTCLAVIEGKRIEEFSPDGQLMRSFPVINPGFTDFTLLSASRGMNDTLLVSASYRWEECEVWWFFRDCWWNQATTKYRLGANGEMTYLGRLDSTDPRDWQSLHEDTAGRWIWVNAEMEAPDQTVNSQPRIWRELAASAGSAVGFERSALITTNTHIRLQIPRAGNTTEPGWVQGRVLAAESGRWIEVPNSEFKLPLPAGVGGVALELTVPAPSVGTPLREYRVRLESAGGAELSPFTECRLWVFGDGQTIPEGELRVTTPAASDTPDTRWLLAHWPLFNWSQTVQTKGILGAGAWEHLLSRITEPALQAFPINSASAQTNRFFRITY